jgi:hypothetical protein
LDTETVEKRLKIGVINDFTDNDRNLLLDVEVEYHLNISHILGPLLVLFPVYAIVCGRAVLIFTLELVKEAQDYLLLPTAL